METKLKNFFKGKEHKKSIYGTIDSSNLYIIDYKNHNGGDVRVLPTPDFDIKHVHLKNTNEVAVFYYIFQDFSFKKEIVTPQNGLDFESSDSTNSYRHCECILFPNNLPKTNKDRWILLIETKYAENYQAASKKKNNYPHCMVEQIISTAEYLRRHNIIPSDKIVDAIVSFPTLITNYQSTLFQGYIYNENEKVLDNSKSATNNQMSLTEIVNKYRIRIKAQNHAIINNATKLSYT